MIVILSIVFFAAFAFFATNRTQAQVQPLSRSVSRRLEKLWLDAQSSIREKKYLRAEKALLTILRFDQKNASAYNRLGILYAKQKEYQDAIHCFEVASSIEPSSSSLHNLGLIYYEVKEFEKASIAFEQAIKLEDGGVASRHVALAKALQQLERNPQMIAALERAIAIEPNKQTYTLLAEAYDHAGEVEKAKEMRTKIKHTVVQKGRPARIKQPRKVVM